jgi:hypothetical protein
MVIPGDKRGLSWVLFLSPWCALRICIAKRLFVNSVKNYLEIKNPESVAPDYINLIF